MDVPHRQPSRGAGPETRAIEDQAVVLAVGFHRPRLHVALGRGQVVEQGGGRGQPEAGHRDEWAGRRRHRRQGPGDVALDQRAEPAELPGDPARLVDRRAEVVARHGREILAVGAGVGAGGEAERGAAVGHVEAERRAVREHPADNLVGPRGRHAIVRLTPVVERARVEFAAGQRGVRPEPAELPEGAGGIQREVRDREGARHGAAPERVGPVTGEERHREAGGAKRVADEAQVAVVVAVAAVLVLDLHEDDRAPARALQRGELAAEPPQPGAGGGEITRVAAPHPQVRRRQQPGRQPAEVPLGADVRAGPQDHLEPLGGREADECGDVGVAPELEPSRRRLVDAPEDVRAHRIEAQGAQHLQAMAPVGAGDAREMELAAPELEGPARQLKARPPHHQPGGGIAIRGFHAPPA